MAARIGVLTLLCGLALAAYLSLGALHRLHIDPRPGSEPPVSHADPPVGSAIAVRPAHDSPAPEATVTSLPAGADQQIPAGRTKRGPVESPASSERQDELPLPKDHVFEVLDGLFSAETIDPTWSRQTAASILERIANMSPWFGYTDIEAECRKTLCRVELHLAGNPSAKLFDDFSVAATMQGSAVRTAIEDSLDLEAAVSDSGIVYGLPAFLMYLRRVEGGGTGHPGRKDR